MRDGCNLFFRRLKTAGDAMLRPAYAKQLLGGSPASSNAGGRSVASMDAKDLRAPSLTQLMDGEGLSCAASGVSALPSALSDAGLVRCRVVSPILGSRVVLTVCLWGYEQNIVLKPILRLLNFTGLKGCKDERTVDSRQNHCRSPGLKFHLDLQIERICARLDRRTSRWRCQGRLEGRMRADGRQVTAWMQCWRQWQGEI